MSLLRSGTLLATVVVALQAANPPGGGVGVPARPVTLSESAAARATREIEEARRHAEAWLRGEPTSYLATIRRVDFGERQALSVGGAPDNDVRLDAAGISAHHLRVTVQGDRFLVEAIDPAAAFRLKDAETRRAVVDPTTLRIGRFTLRLSHQRFPAIIVFDPESPRLKAYKGFSYFPVDLAYRYELPLTPHPSPEAVIIMSTLGHQRRAIRVGWFDFLVNGTPCRLEATRLLEPGVGERDLIVLFRDATSGQESYPLGRYVDPKPLPDGRYLLDFNSAYNPACAYSNHYNCPIPPKANTLKVAIRAGERDSHYH